MLQGQCELVSYISHQKKMIHIVVFPGLVMCIWFILGLIFSRKIRKCFLKLFIWNICFSYTMPNFDPDRKKYAKYEPKTKSILKRMCYNRSF